MINILPGYYDSINGLTAEQKAAIDAQGGVAEWNLPDYSREWYAYNPIVCTAKVYKFGGGDTDKTIVTPDGTTLYFDAEGAERVTLPIYVGATLAVTLEVEAYKGVATIDLSPIAKSFFGRVLTYIDAYRNTVQLQFQEQTITFVVRNGVAQIGESSKMHSTARTTRAEYLVKYPNYMLSYVKGDSVLVLSLDSSTDIPIEEGCVPVSPFYVRWLNAQGGVDYWMFSRAQEHNPSVSKTDTYDVYTEYPDIAPTNRQAYGITTKNSITVGAEGVGDNWDVLKGLPFSPIIQWYNEKLSKWIGLTVAKYDGSIRLDHYTHSIEIKFDLPTINTQF